MTSSECPPQDLQAEKGVLGSICLANEALDEVPFLEERHFYAASNATIFQAIRRLRNDRDVAIDAVTLADALDRCGELVNVGGPAYLAEVLDAVPHAAHARYYASIVLERWQRRELIHGAMLTARDARSGSSDPGEIAAAAEARIQAVVAPDAAGKIIDAGDALNSLFARIEAGRPLTLPTGYDSIDRLIDGIPQTGLSLLAARPSCGKTALACGIMQRVAGARVPVLFFSLEQPPEQLAERWLCDASTQPAWAIRHPERTDEVIRDQVAAASTRIAELPIKVFYDARATVGNIVATSRFAIRKWGVGLVVIDYMGLIVSEEKKLPRQEQVANISKALRQLSCQAGVPVLCLSQLNRASETRSDKRPMLADLRESGSLEQDADLVAILHRPAMHNPDANQREAELIIAKNRSGPIGTVPLEWVGDRMTFQDPPHDYRFAGEQEGNG